MTPGIHGVRQVPSPGWVPSLSVEFSNSVVACFSFSNSVIAKCNQGLRFLQGSPAYPSPKNCKGGEGGDSVGDYLPCMLKVCV